MAGGRHAGGLATEYVTLNKSVNFLGLVSPSVKREVLMLVAAVLPSSYSVVKTYLLQGTSFDRLS